MSIYPNVYGNSFAFVWLMGALTVVMENMSQKYSHYSNPIRLL